MADVKIKAQKTTVTTYELSLGESDIRELLASNGVYIPEGASVYVTIPGGGDWSNENLEIEGETKIEIRWTETTHEQ